MDGMADSIYPMNLSARFPAADAPAARWRAADNFSGMIINPHTGDMTVEAAYRTIAGAWHDVYRSLAFFDVVDTKLDGTAAAATAANEALQRLETSAAAVTHGVSTLESRVDSLIATVTAALAAAGHIIVPQWLDTREVEQGDSMGLERESAEALGLKVRYVPEAPHADSPLEVAYTDPAAGALAERGSTVTVYTKP